MAKRKADDDASTNGNTSKKRAVNGDGIKFNFRPGLFDNEIQAEYVSSYATSGPYKHGVIRELIDDDLLRSVRSEIISEINFTPKETDIYKIHQSGDLANLDGLDDASLGKLPSLLKLRDSLYSKDFRKWISTVGNSGPLSGKKTDMAINVYTPGCHLLCHDDVIGSRRLSYILYLTDPDKPWQAEWGGSLRLYPTTSMKNKDSSMESIVPSSEFSVIIPPSWNQLSFFTIQPGLSFHDVGEVYHRKEGEPGEDVDGGRVRMAISGWFHIPQEGEEGYEEGLEERLAEKSSLNQLQQKEADQFDLPQPRWRDVADDETDQEEDEWNADDLQVLAQIINPIYLMPDTLEELAETFAEESVVTLKDFLHPKEAAKLKAHLLKEDTTPPSFTKAHSSLAGVARPPHKHRYIYHLSSQSQEETPDMPPQEALLNSTISSPLFTRWLRALTNLHFSRSSAMLRRFRRGQDYTLATGYDAAEAQLEVCLGLTPTEGWGGAAADDDDDDDDDGDDGIPATAAGRAKPQDGAEGDENGEDAQVGGYEVYMAADDDDEDDEDEDDESGLNNNNNQHNGTSSTTGAGNRGNSSSSNSKSKSKNKKKADPAIYKAAAEDGEADDDDGVLFSMPASWNTLSVVLRDRGILKFVKYVSESAPGDRWDITALYTVKPDEDEEDDQ